MKKTKIMINNNALNHEIKVNDKVVEYFQEYIYIGQKIKASRS